jgi:hypothetical protein
VLAGYFDAGISRPNGIRLLLWQALATPPATKPWLPSSEMSAMH